MVIEAYNCHGFSRTADYVLDRLQNCDILGLTETWFRPNELNSIKCALENHPSFKNCHTNFEVFSKSGMSEVESDYSGRPFGGVSVIIKPNEYYNCKEIENLSDRIISVELYDGEGNLIQVICCTYMPYFNGKSEQTDLFVETIDELQAVVDQYASIAPIKIIGDLNTQLPTSQKLAKNWHTQRKFSIYSKILYDFLVYNDFVAADHFQKQKVNYTYFCHENNTYTWIDHIICERREMKTVSSCCIIPEEPGNNSDHLPMQLKYSMSLSEIKCRNNDFHKVNTRAVSPNWSNDRKVEVYNNLVTEKMLEISPICMNNCNDSNIKYEIDQRFEKTNNTLNEATKESGCIPSKVFKT